MKKISTKIYISMWLLTVAVLAFVGIALIINKTVNYYRDFEKVTAEVFDNAEFDKVPHDADSICAYAVSKKSILSLGSEKSVYVFQNGNIVKSTVTGGTVTPTDNLRNVLAGGKNETPSVTSRILDYAKRIDDEYTVYVVDSRAELKSGIAEITVLFLQALAIGMVLALILGYVISKRLTHSVNKLTEGAKRMSEGEFVTVDVISDDEIGNLCKVFNDMSRQIQNDFDEFEREEKTRREFVANVSHELKTPLTVIKSYSETLNLNKNIDEPTREKFLKVIADETDHMSDTVGKLLTVSGLETNRNLTVTEIRLGKLCNDIVSPLMLDAEKKGIELAVTGDAIIENDLYSVTAILENIITNAVKYTENGKVTVTVADGIRPTVTVRDTGIGISADDIPHIFDRFYRTDKARGRKTGGSGLGLAIAKESADKIGAKIEVESELRRYTEFTVRF